MGMTDAPWGDLIERLGVAAFLVVGLFYLLRQATEERKAITTEFLKTLRETVAANAQAQTGVTAAINDLALADRERKAAATAEHQQITQRLEQIAEVFRTEISERRRAPA